LVAPDGTIALLVHKESYKISATAPLRLLNETVRNSGNGLESTSETITRAFHEELGIDQPSDLSLSTEESWRPVAYPLFRRNNEPQKHVLVMSVMMLLGEETTERLSLFEETEEIRSVNFYEIDYAIQRPQILREGVAASLRYVRDQGLLDVEPENLRHFQPTQLAGASQLGQDTIIYA
jgi:8-oxo-dGTP pyrophosphatase MutT (NUDIX family)